MMATHRVSKVYVQNDTVLLKIEELRPERQSQSSEPISTA